jgi:hypothetical protein
VANQAKISLSLDGNDQVVAGLKGVKKAEDELRQSLAASEKDYQSYSSSASKGVTARSAAVTGLKAVMEGAYRAAVDLSRASNDIRPINIQQSADRARAFDDVVTRLAVRGGKNVEELKSKFKATGVEIGYLPERVANTARALSHLTYNADAADAVKDLGNEANDTDRSLEEMVGLGEVLYNKLGVPANKVGESLQKIRNIAGDVQTVGGHIALEDTLVRLGPLLARFQGGVTRAAATVAVFGRGKTQQVGEQENASIFGALESADPLLVTRTVRQELGKKTFEPYQRDPATGQVQLKKEAVLALQRRLKRVPFAAALRFFGNDIGAAQTFRSADFSEVVSLEEGPAKARAKAAGLVSAGEAFDLSDIKYSDAQRIKEIDAKALGGKAVVGSQFVEEKAGIRRRTEVERGNVELGVGDVVQGQRDKRNAAFAGRRDLQAAADTAQSYLPGVAQDVLNLGQTAVVEAKDSHDKARASSKVEIGDASIKRLADSIKQGQPASQPGPAAQAVEQNKRNGSQWNQ